MYLSVPFLAFLRLAGDFAGFGGGPTGTGLTGLTGAAGAAGEAGEAGAGAGESSSIDPIGAGARIGSRRRG